MGFIKGKNFTKKEYLEKQPFTISVAGVKYPVDVSVQPSYDSQNLKVKQ